MLRAFRLEFTFEILYMYNKIKRKKFKNPNKTVKHLCFGKMCSHKFGVPKEKQAVKGGLGGQIFFVFLFNENRRRSRGVARST